MPSSIQERSIFMQGVKVFYDEMVDRTVDLMKQLNCTTPLSIFCLFNQLNKKYLIEKEREYMLNNRPNNLYLSSVEDDDLRGLSVLLYGGICRHQSAMLIDILKKMGYDAITLTGYIIRLLDFHYQGSIEKEQENLLFIKQVEQALENGESLGQYKARLKRRKINWTKKVVNEDYYINNLKNPNHQIVFTGDDKGIYLDPMNNVSFYGSGDDLLTLSEEGGLYFFTLMGMNKLIWRNFNVETHSEEEEIFKTLIAKPRSIELDNLAEMEEILSYLKRYSKTINDFTGEVKAQVEPYKRKLIL